MRVKDLIEELQKQNPDDLVCVFDDDWHTLLPIAKAERLKARREIDSDQFTPAPLARKRFQHIVRIS